MVHGSLNPNIKFLDEKLWPVAWNKKFTSVYIRKKSKNAYKKRNNENFVKQKIAFFLMSQWSLNPEIRFLGQMVWPVARLQTDRHESDYRGHPFRVSWVFPSTCHQGSAKYSFGDNNIFCDIRKLFFSNFSRHGRG